MAVRSKKPKGSAGSTGDCGFGTFGVGNGSTGTYFTGCPACEHQYGVHTHTGTGVKIIEIVPGSGGGGGDGHRYKIDKIIQIAVSESGTIYGLSESGKTYYCFRGKWEIVTNSPKDMA